MELVERLPEEREAEPLAAPVRADAELADVARLRVLRELRYAEREAGDALGVLRDEPQRRIEAAATRVLVQPFVEVLPAVEEHLGPRLVDRQQFAALFERTTWTSEGGP
jgi:hypothetical protein